MTRRAALLLGMYALVGGVLSLAGWVLDIPRLTDWLNSGISILPNTALCVVFSGLAVLALATERTRAAALSGAVVLCIGGLTLLQYISGVSLGIDTLLSFEREWGNVGVLVPGRMGLPSSFSWTLIGSALVMTDCRAPLCRVAPSLPVIAAAISGLSLLGYMYGIDKLYAVPPFTAIALQTSTFIMAVSVGIIVSHRDREPMRTLLDPGSAGLLARRTFPLLLIIPVVLGWLRVKGQEAELFDTGLGTGLLVLLLIGLLIALMSRPLRALRERERREQEATNQLILSRQAELERRVEMEALVQAAPAAIWVARDPDCKYITGNPAAAALMRMEADANMAISGTTPESTQPVSVFRDGEWVAPDDLPMRIAARTGQPVPNQDLEFRFPHGDSNWAYGNAVPLLDANGKVRGVIATFVDITPLKLAESMLRDADRRKDEFLATLAHELRNPLAPIRNALALMASAPETGAAVGAREMITRQVSQMVRLIDDLMDVSRISRGHVPLRLEHVALEPLIEQAVEACRSHADNADQEVTVTFPGEPLHLKADPVRLAQVFTNLLNNACKFTPDGGRVALSVERHGSDVVIAVKDSGIGIPSDKLDDIFDMFSQLNRTLEKSEGGLGIGLTLVKRLVELHGGSVSARSEGVGRGSEFVVRLPLTFEAPPRRVELGDHEPTSRTHRILVVDDNRDSADSLVMLLQLSGHEMLVAYDGEQAVDVAHAHRPEMILLDIGLPKLNGFDVCRRIREEPWGKDVTVIALTGWGQEDDRRKSREAGFDGHLVKPVDHAALMRLLTVERANS